MARIKSKSKCIHIYSRSTHIYTQINKYNNNNKGTTTLLVNVESIPTGWNCFGLSEKTIAQVWSKKYARFNLLGVVNNSLYSLFIWLWFHFTSQIYIHTLFATQIKKEPATTTTTKNGKNKIKCRIICTRREVIGERSRYLDILELKNSLTIYTMVWHLWHSLRWKRHTHKKECAE